MEQLSPIHSQPVGTCWENKCLDLNHFPSSISYKCLLLARPKLKQDSEEVFCLLQPIQDSQDTEKDGESLSGFEYKNDIQ